MRAAAGESQPRAAAPLTTATWAAFSDTIATWRSNGRPPSTVRARDVPRAGSGARQVVQTLGALGLIDSQKVPKLALHRLVRGGEPVVLEALRERWPQLMDAIDRADANPGAVDTCFYMVTGAASAESARRFRSFVLNAHVADTTGEDVGRRSAKLPARIKTRVRPTNNSDERAFVKAQIRWQIETLAVWLDTARADTDLATATKLMTQLRNLRSELLRT